MSETAAINTKAARAMRSAYEGNKNGALLCEASSAKRMVFFEQGSLVGAKSNLPSERLGAVMVRHGRITQAQLDEATEYIRTGRKLGQILLELDYLKGGEIETFVRHQIVDIACNILISTPDRLVFSDQVPVEAVTLSPVSIGDVFLEGVRRLPDIGLYRENVLIDDYVLAQSAEAVAIATGMELSPHEGYVLDLVDGKSTVGDILRASPGEEETTLRLLIALHQAGVVALADKRPTTVEPPKPRPTPQPASVDPFEKEVIALHNEIQCQNHWQVLGLQRNAVYADVERAFAELNKRFAQDKYEHLPDSDFQEKVAYVRARIREAYVTLSSQTSTNVYDQLVDREEQYEEKKDEWEEIAPEPTVDEDYSREKDVSEAARLFKRAQRAYKEQDFWPAIELCRTSIELDEEAHPERFHLLGCALAENPRWRQDAEKNLQIAIKLEPWSPRFLVSLAQLYEKEGLTARAERAYDQVRAIDPDYAIPKSDGKKAKKAAKEEDQKVG